jgi:hypothetical protein
VRIMFDVCITVMTSYCISCRKRKQHESSIFDELSVHDSDALGQVDDGADITGEANHTLARCFIHYVGKQEICLTRKDIS